MTEKDRKRGQERSVPVVVKQIRDDVVQLGAPDFELPSDLLPRNLKVGQALRVTISVAIESPHTRDEWSRAYAKQGASDLSTYQVLRERQVHPCHWLHYLQMASEKIAKAHQFRHTYKDIESLLTQHQGLIEFINTYYRSPEMKARFAGREEQLRSMQRDLTAFAAELQKLAPAVDREKSPSNAEYPWSNGVTLTVPCEHTYAMSASFSQDVRRRFVQTLKEASQDLLR